MNTTVARVLFSVSITAAFVLSACGGGKSAPSKTDDGTTPSPDCAGIVVSPRDGLTTSEAGTSAHFSVVLECQPTDNVTIVVTSVDTSEVVVDPASTTLVFSRANWDTLQTVTLTGVDDTENDGAVAVVVHVDSSTSADAHFAALAAIELTVINTDNNDSTLELSSTTLVTEEGAEPVTVTVRPRTRPQAGTRVVVAVASGDIAEGTVSPTELIFDESNWMTSQTVTVTPVDDTVQDGDRTYAISLDTSASTDSDYATQSTSISVTNYDDDTPGFRFDPQTVETIEQGAVAIFSIRPSSVVATGTIVSLTLVSDDTSEGLVNVTSLAFDADNWRVPQEVTVTPVDDNDADGAQTYTITLDPSASTASDYTTFGFATVSVTNADDETARLDLSPSSLNMTETGPDATFTAVLGAAPPVGTSVVVSVTSTDVTEGTVSPSSLVFDNSNWNVPQTVTVTPVGDDDFDGTQTYAIVLDARASTATAYAALSPTSVSVANANTNVLANDITELFPFDFSIAAGNTNVYSFATVAGQTYSVVLTGASLGTLVLTVADTDTFLSPLCTQASSGASSRICTVSASGSRLFIQISGGSSAYTPTLIAAQHLPTVPYVGQTVLNTSFFVAPMSSGIRHRITLANLSSTADLTIYNDSAFFTNSATCVSAHTGTTNEMCETRIGTNTAYIGVSDPQATGGGTYTLNVQEFTPAPATIGTSYAGTIESKAWQYFTIPVVSGNSYDVALTDLVVDVDLYIYSNAAFSASACTSSYGGSYDDICTVTANTNVLYVAVLGYTFGLLSPTPFTLATTEHVVPTPTDITGLLPYVDTVTSSTAPKHYRVAKTANQEYRLRLLQITGDVDLVAFHNDSFSWPPLRISRNSDDSDENLLTGSDATTWLYFSVISQTTGGSFTVDMRPYTPPTVLTTASLPFAGTVAAQGATEFSFSMPGGVYDYFLEDLNGDANLAVYTSTNLYALSCQSQNTGTSSETCRAANSASSAYIIVTGTATSGPINFTLRAVIVP